MSNIKIILLYLVITSVCYSQQPRENISGDYLIKTKWSGSEPFNSNVPKYELGCHSVAIAQILFYHKLIPRGRVDYICGNGLKVEKDLSHYNPDLSSFANNINDPEEKLLNTAEYLYNIACIVKKDFGTDQYIKCDDFHKSEIESQFNCQYQAYPEILENNIAEILHKKDGYYSKIIEGIDAGQPLGFYYTSYKNNGHAVVIDGYLLKDDKIFIHANFGWNGKSDGWYLLEEDLPRDLKFLLLIVINPTIN